MTMGTSRDALHVSPSAERAPRRDVGAKRRVDTPRVGPMRRLLHILALAVVTLVCAGITSPARSIANPAAPIDVAASDGSNAARAGLARQPAHLWHGARRVFDVKVAEAEIEDDDRHPLSDTSEDPAVPVRGSFPRNTGRASRSAPQSDTSRFAIGTGLPRGPPA